MATSLDQVLERTLAVLPVTKDDLLVRGIAGEVTDRIVELKKAAARFQDKYKSPSLLEGRIKQEGVSPDDHTLYTDLIEWRAIESEVRELLAILGEI
ncbi:MAG: hypothetical protein HY782_10050 [Chloroflexi bacterium]|nr:hypothetical protein [Chloroflexota bacterium]